MGFEATDNGGGQEAAIEAEWAVFIVKAHQIVGLRLWSVINL